MIDNITVNGPKMVSLFSGCGGLDCGFMRAGFDVIWIKILWCISSHKFLERLCSSNSSELSHAISHNFLEKLREMVDEFWAYGQDGFQEVLDSFIGADVLIYDKAVYAQPQQVRAIVQNKISDVYKIGRAHV